MLLFLLFQSVLQRRVRLSRKRVGTTFPLMRVATTRLASGCHVSSRTIKTKGKTSVPSLCSPRHQGAGTLTTTSNQQGSLSHKTTRRQTKLDSGYHLQLVGKKDKHLYKQKNEKESEKSVSPECRRGIEDLEVFIVEGQVEEEEEEEDAFIVVAAPSNPAEDSDDFVVIVGR